MMPFHLVLFRLTRENILSNTSYQLRLDMGKGQKQGRNETTQED